MATEMELPSLQPMATRSLGGRLRGERTGLSTLELPVCGVEAAALSPGVVLGSQLSVSMLGRLGGGGGGDESAVCAGAAARGGVVGVVGSGCAIRRPRRGDVLEFCGETRLSSDDSEDVTSAVPGSSGGSGGWASWLLPPPVAVARSEGAGAGGASEAGGDVCAPGRSGEGRSSSATSVLSASCGSASGERSGDALGESNVRRTGDLPTASACSSQTRNEHSSSM